MAASSSEAHDAACNVCHELLDEVEHCPRMLPACGHSLCQGCACRILSRGEVQCPFDRVVSKAASVSCLPKNWMVIDQLRAAAASASAGKTRKCELCTSDHVAALHCTDCGQVICMIDRAREYNVM